MLVALPGDAVPPAVLPAVLSTVPPTFAAGLLVHRDFHGAAGWVPPPAVGGAVPEYERAQELLSVCADCALCRVAACIARVASHPHAPPFCAPVDVETFPDYVARVGAPVDLRTIAEALALGVYGFGHDGDAHAAAEAVRHPRADSHAH